jgi:hypothetical protein
MRAEASCVNPAGLKALWQWSQGGDGADTRFRELTAAWDEWRRELDQMERFLRDEADPRTPFLYAFRSDLFTPGRSAAVLGDRAWDPVLPLLNALWEKRDAMLAGRDADGAARVEETIRQANIIWGGFVAAGHSVRAWRPALNTAVVAAFFDRLAEEPKRPQENP